MSIADRTEQTTGEGALTPGAGTLGHGSSGALDGLPAYV